MESGSKGVRSKLDEESLKRGQDFFQNMGFMPWEPRIKVSGAIVQISSELQTSEGTQSATPTEMNLRAEELFLTRFVIYDLTDYPGDLSDSQSRKLSGLRLF
jgi:hypothetical protein